VSDDLRLDDLADNLRLVRERVGAACRAAGREPETVTVVAVSKTWPAADVLRLHSLGQREFGENRDQEARAKAAALSAAGAEVRWHFVGRLQRNKCASVARYADVVHAVDRPELVAGLSAGAGRAGRTLDVLAQLSIDGDPQRGGALVGELPGLADQIAAAPGLRLSGVMAIAPVDWDPDRAFAALADVAATVRRTHPEATMVSAGMTDDLEPALAHGSTCVRVGTALFGGRDTPLR